jgi:phosphonate transport system substrate-binding protein
MGIVPQQSPLKLLKVWKPIAAYLSEKTGEKITFKTEKSIKEFESVLYSGGYDFAYMSPIHYLVSHKRHNYIALLRSNEDNRGIIIMKKGDSIEKLKDKNSRFLFPVVDAFASTLLTKYDLINSYGVDMETLNKSSLYVNSHDSVYKGVSRGIGEFGGGIERTFMNISDENTKDSLMIIHTTDAYPSHPFAFKATMKEELREKIVDAMLNMPKPLLEALSIKNLKRIDDTEYDSVKIIAKKLKMPYE